MFDISWTEFLLIGIVALVFIGPKELPAVMRTLGQYTRKVRGMAADFQNQFQEAMREAEMTDLKKQVDDMAHDIKSYDPLKSAREHVASFSDDLSKDFAKTPLELMTGAEQNTPSAAAPTAAEPTVAEPAATESSVTPSSASEVIAAEPAPPLPAPEPKPEPQPSRSPNLPPP